MSKLDSMMEQSEGIRKQMDEYGFLVFPEVDRREDGTIGSQYPCWYHQNQLENDLEDLHDSERQLASGAVPSNRRMQFNADIVQQRTRLAKIKDSIPRPDGPQKDKIAKLHKELQTLIRENMPPEDDMLTGDADAHMEARLMTTPMIGASNDAIRWLLACGTNPETITEDKKVTRNALIKGWKIAARILDLNTNSKALYTKRSRRAAR